MKFIACRPASMRSFPPSAFALTLLVATATAAADLPTFRKGMWEFNRTVAAQGSDGKDTTLSKQQCTDPSADMKRMNDMLAKQGRTFSPISAKGNVYTFSSECRIQGLHSQTQSVLTVEGDDAYSVQVTGTTAGQPTRELLRAKRVGDC